MGHGDPMTTTTPTPLPIHSPRLRLRRFECWVGEPCAVGTYRQTDFARFADGDDARRWADTVHPDAGRVVITQHAKSWGWDARRWKARVEPGVWI